MTNTTKYVLIGGGTLVAVILIGRKILANQATQTTKPTGLAAIAANAAKLTSALDGFSFKSPTDTFATRPAGTPALADGGLPYGPGAGDGYAAVSDATGMRARNAYIPAQTSYLTASERAIAGASY